MKTKPKRIRALRANITRYDTVLANVYNDTEPCYILRQSDVRALAEQFVDDADREIHNPKHKLRCRLDTALHILKRAGMTPGKEAQ